MKGKGSRAKRCLKAITRAFANACDLYVKSMSMVASHVESGAGMHPTTPRVAILPKSLSVNSTRSSSSSRDQDFAELVRVSSLRVLDRKVDSDLLRYQQQLSSGQTKIGVHVMPRSQSVAMGRIDEDKSCHFNGDDGMDVNALRMFQRSRSHAVSTRSGMF